MEHAIGGGAWPPCVPASLYPPPPGKSPGPGALLPHMQNETSGTRRAGRSRLHGGPHRPVTSGEQPVTPKGPVRARQAGFLEAMRGLKVEEEWGDPELALSSKHSQDKYQIILNNPQIDLRAEKTAHVYR